MRQVIDRPLPAVGASLQAYGCYGMRDQYYPAVIPVAGEQTTGLLYSGLTAADLILLDHYEGVEYQRRQVKVKTDAGLVLQAWVYVLRAYYRSLLDEKIWSLEDFKQKHAQKYLQGLKRV